MSSPGSPTQPRASEVSPPASPQRHSLLTKAIHDLPAAFSSLSTGPATPSQPVSWAAKLKGQAILSAAASPAAANPLGADDASVRSSHEWPTLAASLTARASPQTIGGSPWTSSRLQDYASPPVGSSPNGRVTFEEFAAAKLIRYASPSRETVPAPFPSVEEEREEAAGPSQAEAEEVIGEWEEEVEHEAEAGPSTSTPAPLPPSNPWSRPLPFVPPTPEAAPSSTPHPAPQPAAKEQNNSNTCPTSAVAAAAESTAVAAALADQQREIAARFFEEFGEPEEDHEAGDLTCSICLEPFQFENSATIKGCEHTFCAVCIVKWSLHRQACPNCKRPFSHLITYRTLDGTLSDFPQEEPLCLLQRARWLEGAVEHHVATARPHVLSADDAPSGYPSYHDYDEEMIERFFDEEGEEYYEGASSSSRRITLTNRRFGQGGYVRNGRAYARPVQPPPAPSSAGKGGKRGKMSVAEFMEGGPSGKREASKGAAGSSGLPLQRGGGAESSTASLLDSRD